VTAELYIDSENLFFGFRAVSQDQRSDTIQAQLFGTAVGDETESSIARMQRVFTAIMQWCELNIAPAIDRVRSYGKVSDPGVRTVLWALGRESGSFAYVTDPDQMGTDPNFVGPDQWMDVGLFHWRSVPVIHTAVGGKTNAAELRLVDDFRAEVGARTTPTRTLLGSSDHDAIMPFDHAALDPEVRVWVLLTSHRARDVKHFGPFGRYAHIPPSRVISLPELLDDMRVGKNRGARIKRDRWESKRRRAIEAAVDTLAAEAPTVKASTVLRRIALTANIDARALGQVKIDSPGWKKALGERWVSDAVNHYLRDLTSESEWADITLGRVHVLRLLSLVRICVIRRALENQFELTHETLRDGLDQLGLLTACAGELALVFVARGMSDNVLSPSRPDSGLPLPSASDEPV
jgi:hypothetical protein